MKNLILILFILVLTFSLYTTVSAEVTQNSKEMVEFDPFENNDNELSSGTGAGEISDPIEGYLYRTPVDGAGDSAFLGGTFP